MPWPQGVEAQAVTTPPAGVTDCKARIAVQRVDGDVFDLTSFTARLLANTAGAGGDIEIMPSLNGEDSFNDPLYFNASGYYLQSFSYDTSPNYLESTAQLRGFDRYGISLYVDFAFTALTLAGAAVPGPPGDYNNDGGVDAADYTVWRDNVGSLDSVPNDDTAGVGQEDYTRWKTNFGQHFGSGSGVSANATIPEAATLWLLLAGIVTISPLRGFGERAIGFRGFAPTAK